MEEIQPEQIKFIYKFNFKEQITVSFEIKINYQTLLIENNITHSDKEWTKLKNFKCPNCPLDEKENEFCPLAINLEGVLHFFNELPSYKEATVSVETNERITYKETTVQIGVGSLLGIIMASSGCPVIGVLRPLVRFHLPFASLEETEYRVFSTYIFAQYFKFITGGDPDWDLSKLKASYEKIQVVNRNIVTKLSDVELNDTSRNAVVTLSSFAEYIIFNLEDKEYIHLKDVFNSFGESIDWEFSARTILKNRKD
ncbi:MAG: hypothetical protein KKF62_14185 [Bacteroidetes bacterium]|nr:hypothetical protein [Bacteroidota bacterium]MBU1113750.1 hypothetical protein [Bacteroidota bacterium]MBU1800096.1 hypothetical protein [Bacteroidota bacterium]